MIRCYKCGFGHLTEEGLKKCKSWAEMQAEKVADIGKLDGADKKICECGDSFFFHKTVCLGINEAGNCKCNKFRPAGSAETGGEKA